MLMYRHHHKSVGLHLTNDEHAEFVRLARSNGLSPAQLAQRLARAEIARNAAPSVVPQITEERRVYA